MSEAALFLPLEAGYQPSESARSPWSLELLHGGPVAALLAHAIEEAAEGESLRLMRLTTDLFRPVPYAPLRVETETLRAGRRIAVLRASLFAGELEVTRAQGLLLATRPGAEPGLDVLREPPPFAEASGEATRGSGELRYASAVEWRDVTRRGDGQPATSWMRAPFELLPGVPFSPSVRAAAISDFVNPLANMAGGAPYINADITLYLTRPPQGEWLCLQVTARGNEAGLATGAAELFDRRGSVGRCQAASLAQERGAFEAGPSGSK